MYLRGESGGGKGCYIEKGKEFKEKCHVDQRRHGCSGKSELMYLPFVYVKFVG